MDIRPENIMIKGDPDFSNGQRHIVALIDLGNAIKEEKKTIPRGNCIAEYRPPEIILGLPINKKVDSWVVGALMAEMLTTNSLFQKKEDSITVDDICMDQVSFFFNFNFLKNSLFVQIKKIIYLTIQFKYY